MSYATPMNMFHISIEMVIRKVCTQANWLIQLEFISVPKQEAIGSTGAHNTQVSTVLHVLLPLQ